MLSKMCKYVVEGVDRRTSCNGNGVAYTLSMHCGLMICPDSSSISPFPHSPFIGAPVVCTLCIPSIVILLFTFDRDLLSATN